MTLLMTLNRHKIKTYVIITSLKSETMGTLIKRLPGSRLLISTSVSIAMSTSVLKALVGKLEEKFNGEERAGCFA